jgi:Pentapeptide repeats (8 copies)
MATHRPRAHLRADCASCSALCCVAPTFEVSADFPIHKPAGEACPHLSPEYRCRIHDHLRQKGFLGCAAFDCFGAGPRITGAFGERTWRTDPALGQQMFRSFGVLRLLHEILWYLEEASDRLPDGTMRDEVHGLRQRITDAARSEPQHLLGLDVAGLQSQSGQLLERVSLTLRRGPPLGASLRGADLAGGRFEGADFRRADLRAACLIRANLRGADLRQADLLGADLRGADLRSANLVDTIFLTQTQVQAAIIDRRTELPPVLEQPPHW